MEIRDRSRTEAPRARATARGGSTGSGKEGSELKVTSIGVFALVLMLLSGCDSYVHGNGVFGQESRSVPVFDGVSIGLGIVGTVRAGAADTSVTISGDANVLQYIKTEVVEGVLTTRLSGVDDYQSEHPVQLVVATPLLASVEASGGARVTASSITESGTFTATAREGSSVTLTAADLVTATLLSVTASGTATVDAAGYPALDGTAALSGGSRADVKVTGTVTGSLTEGSTLTVEGGGTCAVTATGTAACLEKP